MVTNTEKISCSVKIILKTSILSDFDPFRALNSSYARIKAKYCLQMYNRIIISNFPQNLIVISQFFSFFFVIFSVFVILVIFGLFFYPQTPGGPKFLAMELNLSQAPLRCQPASKNCFMITFFCVNSAKTLIWSFSLFWGILVGL